MSNSADAHGSRGELTSPDCLGRPRTAPVFTLDREQRQEGQSLGQAVLLH